MEIYIFTLFVNILMIFVCNGVHIEDENANHYDDGHFDGNRKGDEITQEIMARNRDNEPKNVFIPSHIQPIKPKNNKRNAKKENVEKISDETQILQNQTSVKTTTKSKLNQNNLKSTIKYSTVNEKLKQTKLISTKKSSTVHGPTTVFGSKLKQTTLTTKEKSSTVHGPTTVFGSKLKETNSTSSIELSTTDHKLTTSIYVRNLNKSTTPAMKKHKRFLNLTTDSSKRKSKRYKKQNTIPKRTKLSRIFKPNTKKSSQSEKNKKTIDKKPVRKQKFSTNKSNSDKINNIFFRQSKPKYNHRNIKLSTKNNIKSIKNKYPHSEIKRSMNKQSLTNKVPGTTFHRRKKHKSFTTSKHSKTQNQTLVPIQNKRKMDLKQYTRFTVQTGRTPTVKQNYVSFSKQYGRIKYTTMAPTMGKNTFKHWTAASNINNKLKVKQTPGLKMRSKTLRKQTSSPSISNDDKNKIMFRKNKISITTKSGKKTLKNSIPQMQGLKSTRNKNLSSGTKNQINRSKKSETKNGERMKNLITISMNRKSRNLRRGKNQMKKTTPKNNSSRNKNKISIPRYRKNKLRRAEKPTVLQRRDRFKHYRNQITDNEKRTPSYKKTMSRGIQNLRRNQKQKKLKRKEKSTRNTSKRYKTVDKSKHVYKHTALPKMISRNKNLKTEKIRRIFYKTILPKHSRTNKNRNLIPKIYRSRNIKKVTEKSKTKGRRIQKINGFRKKFDKSSLPLRYNSKSRKQKNVINSRNKLKNIRKQKIIPQMKNLKRKTNKAVLLKRIKSNNKNENTRKLKMKSRRRNKNKIVHPKKRKRTSVFGKARGISGGRKIKRIRSRTNKSKQIKNNKVINAHKMKNNLKKHKKRKSKNNTLTVMGKNKKPSQLLNNTERLNLKRSVNKVNGTFVLDEGTNEWVIKKEDNFTPDDYSLSPGNRTFSIEKPNITVNDTLIPAPVFEIFVSHNVTESTTDKTKQMQTYFL